MRNLLLLIGIALFWHSCNTETVPESVLQQIDKVKSEYAPDKRVAIFDISARLSPEGIVLEGETNLAEAHREILDRLETEGITVSDSIRRLPSADLGEKTFGVVRLSVCNIRSEPGHSQELSTQATLGTPLTVYKKEDGWYLVQTPDQYLGWLDPGGFTLMSPEEYNAWMDAEKVVYLPDFGFSHPEPDENSGRVSDLISGNFLIFHEANNGFAKVEYPDERTGYVPAEDVMPHEQWLASREPTVENVIRSAFSFMGRPYLWGGTSGKGVDCSGFTKSVFYLNGVLLPRDASQQVHVGIDVPTDTTLANLQPGDFLFFGRKATADRKERITHVAIYLGDGKIIHSSGIVKVESLRRGDPDFAEHRLNTFVRAKRMLTSLGENGVELLADSPYYQ